MMKLLDPLPVHLYTGPSALLYSYALNELPTEYLGGLAAN